MGKDERQPISRVKMENLFDKGAPARADFVDEATEMMKCVVECVIEEIKEPAEEPLGYIITVRS